MSSTAGTSLTTALPHQMQSSSHRVCHKCKRLSSECYVLDEEEGKQREKLVGGKGG